MYGFVLSHVQHHYFSKHYSTYKYSPIVVTVYFVLVDILFTYFQVYLLTKEAFYTEEAAYFWLSLAPDK